MLRFVSAIQVGCRRIFLRDFLGRITTLTILAVSFCVLQSLSLREAIAETKERPNIIFIMADDME